MTPRQSRATERGFEIEMEVCSGKQGRRKVWKSGKAITSNNMVDNTDRNNLADLQK